jgi:hypothetical protein
MIWNFFLFRSVLRLRGTILAPHYGRIKKYFPQTLNKYNYQWNGTKFKSGDKKFSFLFTFKVNLVFFTAENFALPGEAGFPLNAFYPKPNK